MRIGNMQLTLTKVSRTTTSKDGQPLVTKDGRPYTRLSVKTAEHGDKWLSGFDGPQTKNWAEGSKVEAEVEQKGEYLNFRVPKPIDKVDEKLEQLLNYVVGIKMNIEVIKAHLIQNKPHVVDDSAYTQSEPPEGDVNPDDVPF